MKQSGRYRTSDLTKAQHQPGSRGRVLLNLQGIKRKQEMDRVEAVADARHEPADGHVVEEEERRGPGAGQVVGAHRHEVDADRVVAAGVEREPELGADAIRARDEHRSLPAARWQLDHRAERRRSPTLAA